MLAIPVPVNEEIEVTVHYSKLEDEIARLNCLGYIMMKSQRKTNNHVHLAGYKQHCSRGEDNVK